MADITFSNNSLDLTAPIVSITNMVLISSAPANENSAGIVGQVASDEDFVYICTATNKWKAIRIHGGWLRDTQ